MPLKHRPRLAQAGGRHQANRKLLETLVKNPLSAVAANHRVIIGYAGQRSVERPLRNAFRRGVAFHLLEPLAKTGRRRSAGRGARRYGARAQSQRAGGK